MLTISLSQSGVNHLLSAKLGADEYASINAAELEKQLANYITANFALTIDGQVVKPDKGGIKLGSHQTDLKFVLPPLPKDTKDIEIYIPAFQETENHQTIFSYFINGKTDHVILSARNDFRTTLISPASAKTNSESPLAYHSWNKSSTLPNIRHCKACEA